MKRKIILTTVIFLAIVTVLIFYPRKLEYKTKEIKIGDKNIVVEVADRSVLRKKGLSERESLSENRGMFFVFEKPGEYGFWMKDMKFPIDIVWLNEECEVISIKENALPEDFPLIYYPENAAQYALEVSSGEVSKLELEKGKKYDFCK